MKKIDSFFANFVVLPIRIIFIIFYSWMKFVFVILKLKYVIEFLKTSVQRIGFVLLVAGLIMMFVSYYYFSDESKYLYLLEDSFRYGLLDSDRYELWLNRDGVILFFVGTWLAFVHEYTTKRLITWIKTGSLD